MREAMEITFFDLDENPVKKFQIFERGSKTKSRSKILRLICL